MAVARPRPRRGAETFTVVILSLLGASCGAGPATPVAPSTAVTAAASITPSSSVIAPPSPAAAVTSAVTSAATSPSTTAGDDVFSSTVYPYTLTLPSEVVQVVWHPAQRAWDGHEAIASDAVFNDRNGLVDGGIFVLGTRWTGSLKAFVSTVEQNVVRYHECAVPGEVRPIAVGGAPGTAWSHRCVDIFVARVAAVHDGWGLVASEQVLPDREDGAVDRLAGWIGKGLSWRPS